MAILKIGQRIPLRPLDTGIQEAFETMLVESGSIDDDIPATPTTELPLPTPQFRHYAQA